MTVATAGWTTSSPSYDVDATRIVPYASVPTAHDGLIISDIVEIDFTNTNTLAPEFTLQMGFALYIGWIPIGETEGTPEYELGNWITGTAPWNSDAQTFVDSLHSFYTPTVATVPPTTPVVVPLTDAQKLTSIQDLIDAARLNPPDPGTITVQGQRPNNLGMRGVDVNTFAATSNARRPWQRDRVTTITTINGEQTRYHIQITQNLVPQIDRVVRSIAKAYYDKGFDEGYEDGYENGYRDGYRDGYNQALNDVEAKL